MKNKLFAILVVILLIAALYFTAVNTNRSNAVTFVVSFYPGEVPVSCPFTDIVDDPNRDAICKAYALGITAGYSDTIFGPNDKTPLWQWFIFFGKLGMIINNG